MSVSPEISDPGPGRAPRILQRSEHNLSRKNIDEEALKVLYRLKNQGFVAYLVGGGVRDLLLERRPKDFDVATGAHPQQVRRLFRNAFMVGRRFRLCHVRFGKKVVEVSTFRRMAEPDEGDTLIRSDNTFGTPEEDAFRRDFTVNALFYDIATFSVIDYVGGIDDLTARVIRTIGDPTVRLREDPVRMLRAVALAARLDFRVDRDTVEAIRVLRGDIVKSSPPRLLEEFYKILRQGSSRRTFELMQEFGLLAHLLPEADLVMQGPGRADFLASLKRLDDFRNAGASLDDLSNPVILGSLLVPLGLSLRKMVARKRPKGERGVAADEAPAENVARELAELGAAEPEAEPNDALPASIVLPFARRDIDRLRLILAAQPRLADLSRPPGAQRALAARPYFEDAVRWLSIHGGERASPLVVHWRSLDMKSESPARADAVTRRVEAPRRRRRRRRRPPAQP